MPYRIEPFATEEIYHVFNRSIAKEHIFVNPTNYQRFLDLLSYYRFEKPFIRFSEYNRLTPIVKNEYLLKLSSHSQIIHILAFCCMPNHFHLLLRQKSETGIALFSSLVQNGYAKYFNTKYKRNGSAFQSMFKAVHMETEEQLLHVARYIHLNPFTSGIIQSKKDILKHPWNSLLGYLGLSKFDFLEMNTLSSFFKNKKSFQKYTFDQIDYQRLLFVESHLFHDTE